MYYVKNDTNYLRTALYIGTTSLHRSKLIGDRWWFELWMFDCEHLTGRTEHLGEPEEREQQARRTLLTENGFEQLVEIGQRSIDRTLDRSDRIGSVEALVAWLVVLHYIASHRERRSSGMWECVRECRVIVRWYVCVRWARLSISPIQKNGATQSLTKRRSCRNQETPSGIAEEIWDS